VNTGLFLFIGLFTAEKPSQPCDIINIMNIAESKKVTRNELKSIWNNMTGDEIQEISRKVMKGIVASPQWDEADILLAFLAFGKEISLDELIVHSIKSGKKVYIPRVEGEVINFYRIRALDEAGLKINRMGIREPSDLNDQFVPDEGSRVFVLVPGLGFTADGKRMGRGRGFYDRFLKGLTGLKNYTTAAICCNRTILKDIPTDSHDMKVENLCSESGLMGITP